MSDIRDFMGFAPTHCGICGSRWKESCRIGCINEPLTYQALPTEEQIDALCAEDERRGEGR